MAPNSHRPTSENPPEWLIRNVTRWLPLVHRWHSDFPQLDPAWILAVMAQESQGFPNAEANDTWGSMGLLQIGPRPWIGTREQLRDPAYNIYKGMDLLADTLRQSDDIRHALAGYNCGLNRLADGLCGRHGGWAYADKVLDYWLPVFRAELTVRAGEYDLIGNWLATLGYREGLGDWEVMPEIEEEKEECSVLPARRFRPRMCI